MQKPLLQQMNHGSLVQIQARVVPLVQDMLKRETGAVRVVVCDHTVRRGTVEYASVLVFLLQHMPQPACHYAQGLVH